VEATCPTFQAKRGRSTENSFGSFYGDSGDFKAGIEEQLIDAEEGSGREVAVVIGAVDLIERVVVGQVCAIDLEGDDVVHGHAGLFHDLLHVIHDELGFVVKGNRALGGGVNAGSARDVEGIADDDAAAEGKVALLGDLGFEVDGGLGGGKCRDAEEEQQAANFLGRPSRRCELGAGL
jgi:hypothetical protein